jgi:spermidine/putrescine transport system permease protein
MTTRKTPPGPLEYMRRWPIQVWLAAVTIFLYAPLISLMVFSFNDSRRNVVWQGFTLKYYEKALTNASLIEAFTNSLVIALFCTLFSVIVGAMAAIALWRFRFPGRTAFHAGMAIPIVVPEICMGVGMLVFFAKVLPWPQDLPWPLNLGAIIIAHVSFSFPFVAVVVRARLASFNRELEEAAKDLGASEFRALMDVVVRGAAGLHPQPGRLRHHLFHVRAGHGHLPGENLFDGPVLGDAGGQCGLDHSDRRHRPPDLPGTEIPGLTGAYRRP